MPLVFVKSQKNQDQLLLDGYVYAMNVRTSDKCNWRCTEYHRRKCMARVHTKGDEVAFETSRTHNHPPTTAAVAGEVYLGSRRSRQKSSTSAKKLPSNGKAKSTDMSTVSSIVQSLVSDVMAAVDGEGNGDASRMELSVSTAPALMADAFLFHEALSDTEIINERTLLYGTYRNLNLLEKKVKGDRCCWFLDSWFGSSPPLFHRVLVLHAIVGKGVIVPAVYCLLPNDRRETYTRALRSVRNARPTNCPLQIPTDGCGGIMMDVTDEKQVEAFRRAFGDDSGKDVQASIRCCFRHLTRSLWCIIDSNADLRAKYTDDEKFALNVRKLAALAFVPADCVVATFDELMRSPFYVDHDPVLAPLVDHFEDTWIGRPTRIATRRRAPRHPLSTWNCHDAVVRSNLAETLVAIEAWHRSFDSVVFACRERTESQFIDRLQTEPAEYVCQDQCVTAAKLRQIVSAFKKFACVDQFLTAIAYCFRLQYDCCLI